MKLRPDVAVALALAYNLKKEKKMPIPDYKRELEEAYNARLEELRNDPEFQRLLAEEEEIERQAEARKVEEARQMVEDANLAVKKLVKEVAKESEESRRWRQEMFSQHEETLQHLSWQAIIVGDFEALQAIVYLAQFNQDRYLPS